jgi:CRP-like cAMP-binding protein
MDDDVASGHFRAIDLFSGFDDEQLRLLNFVSENQSLARGEVLYDAGEPADGAYVLISGQLEAIHTPAEGGARYAISPPALVGELGLMLTRPRATQIAAKTAAEVIFVPREPFLKILRTDPELAGEVAEILRGELARYLDSISALGPRFK